MCHHCPGIEPAAAVGHPEMRGEADQSAAAMRSLLVSAYASARRMSSSLTMSTDGSVLASSASSCGAMMCSRRARSRLQAMTTLSVAAVVGDVEGSAGLQRGVAQPGGLGV